MSELEPATIPWRSVVLNLLIVNVACLVLALAPDATLYLKTGLWGYLAEDDETLYMAVAIAPYHGETSLRNPSRGPWEQVPSLYAWSQFAPFAKFTAWAGWSLPTLAVLWRVVGALLTGSAFYALFIGLFSSVSHAPSWAAACSLIAIADPGTISGQTLFGTVDVVSQLLSGEATPLGRTYGIFRLVTPLDNLPFLLTFAAAFAFRRQSFRLCMILGGASLGICWLLYFFLWTAACGAMGFWFLGHAVGAIWDSSNRRAHVRELWFAVGVGLIGIALGGWKFVADWRAFHDPELRDLMNFGFPYTLAPEDPFRWNYVWNRLLLAKLALGLWAIVAWKLDRLVLLWCLTLSGYVLTNSAIVTGLEFENFHWSYVTAPCSEVLLAAVAVLALDRSSWSHVARRVFWVLALVLFALCLAWRPMESLIAEQPTQFREARVGLEPLIPALAGLRPDRAIAGPKRVVAIAAMSTRAVQLYHHYTSMSLIETQPLAERVALNVWLQGGDFEAAKEEFEGFGDPYDRRPDAGEKMVTAWREVSERPGHFMNRHRVAYVLLPVDASPQSIVGPWQLMGESERWRLWQRSEE